MAGEFLLLDNDGEIKQQTSLPERSEHTKELQSLGLSYSQLRPPFRGPVALWGTARFTTCRPVPVLGGGQTCTHPSMFIHITKI